MTVELGRVKRGDDKTFRTIVVTVGGSPQDLTASGWSVDAQLRRTEDSATAVTCAADEAELADSRVVLSLTDTQTAAMAPGTWVGDVEVTGPDGVHSSDTFTVEVVADVTRVEA